MKIITFKDIVDLNIPLSKCYEWAKEMIINKSTSHLPPKISIKHMEGVFCNVMPSVIMDGSMNYRGGVKVVTRYPEREPSLDSRILLFDAQTGEFLALMDGDWITTMRTAAVAAHSIDLLAKPDFKEIGIIGLGNIAIATLLIMLEVMPGRNWHIKLKKYKDQAEQFIERFKKYDNLEFEIVDDDYTLIKGSDVVISAVTYAPVDFCSDDAFDEGVLVVPIHTLGFTNCDLFFDKVFADDLGHVHHFKNFDKFKRFAEVSDVINGKASGRENDRERILAYNIGISLHDVNYASHIYEMLKDDDSVIDFDLGEPREKFWVQT